MSKLIVMIGCSYSGKSTIAYRLSEAFGYNIVSTDAIREEMYGDASEQGGGSKVFSVAYERVARRLRLDQDVIFDATSLRASDRRKLIKYLVENVKVPFEAIAVVMETPPIEVIQDRMGERDRVVPTEIVKNQMKVLTMPTRAEGFNEIWSCNGPEWRKLK